ncbi:DUF5719 family protein [Nocardioides lianchengensis]|uniref:Uncharacterized protein n=1 Tax=Nocardioides lianchengensis TaxID=1045774 RepID=A0A1G6JWK4_9ACTN|nr:DUF5719 family protein [Nocardioides lianchengensis]NYG08807.1 hypothetical protein [Nocardioides lianchengensis]SDC23159.1 hypothetical protein SAMN05421872_101609 [Nocardioides lianchengensis]
MSDAPVPGRRSRVRPARRGPDLTVLLAVLLPVLAVGLLLVAGTDPIERADRPPTSTGLTSATLGCPAGLPGAGDVQVLSGGETGGEVTVGDQPVELEAGRAARVEAPDATVVRGTGDLAPGLVAGRSGTAPLAAADCPLPSAQQWFTGVGAGARHSSVVELVNPTAGPAVADVVVLGSTGVVDAPTLRGVLVPGGQTRRLDLAAAIPQEGELALQVTTTRGRLTVSVADSDDRLGSATPTTDWLGGQAEPLATSTLLGLPGGAGRRTLVLANPGADELRAELRFVTADSVFAPQGLQEVRIAPGSTARVALSAELAAATADGTYGVQVSATGPVTASLRSVVRRDISHAVPAVPVRRRTVAVLPEGRKRLQLADASAVGVVVVVARDAAGREVASETLDVTPGAGGTLDLPEEAVQVEVEPRRASVLGAVLVTGQGAAVVRLHELTTAGLVPQVAPGLP